MARMFGGKAGDRERSNTLQVTAGKSKSAYNASGVSPTKKFDTKPAEDVSTDSPVPAERVRTMTIADRKSMWSNAEPSNDFRNDIHVRRRQSLSFLAGTVTQGKGVSNQEVIGAKTPTEMEALKEKTHKANELAKSLEQERRITEAKQAAAKKIQQRAAEAAAAEQRATSARGGAKVETRRSSVEKTTGFAARFGFGKKKDAPAPPPDVRRRGSITEIAPPPAGAARAATAALPSQNENSQGRSRSTTIGAAVKGSNKCPVCTKSVYDMEKVEVEGNRFHKWCFRCNNCNKAVNASSYASQHGSVFCKPCFIKLFKEKGNYDEGFGLKQKKHQWDRANSDANA